MRAVVVFSGSGPIPILSSFVSIDEFHLINKWNVKGSENSLPLKSLSINVKTCPFTITLTLTLIVTHFFLDKK